MTSLPGEVDGRRFLRVLARFGWRVESVHGSHRKLVHANRSEFLIVAFHGKVSRITVRRTLRQAGIDEADFLREL